jgi:hypothetical protein
MSRWTLQCNRLYKMVAIFEYPITLFIISTCNRKDGLFSELLVSLVVVDS